MPPQLFEVYKFAYRLGDVEYRRPWIVIREPRRDANGDLRVLVLGCSTKNYGPNDFKIERHAPEMTATGITAPGHQPLDNYIDKTQPIDVPVSIMGPRRGALTGNLLFRFKWWSGMP